MEKIKPPKISTINIYTKNAKKKNKDTYNQLILMQIKEILIKKLAKLVVSYKK